MPIADDAVIEAVAAALPRDAGPLLVGFSGGLDSTVLLHAAASLRPPRTITAVHVNHHLQVEADAWQRHCRAVGEQMGVVFQGFDAAIDNSGSLEAAARTARYEIWERLLDDGQCLLLGHHADDQLETLLLRLLLRGGGAASLAGMPAARSLGKGRLLRPLLALPRRALRSYAAHHALHWIEDPSNAFVAHDRNFLRHEVLPRLHARWPQALDNLARSSMQLAADADLAAAALDAALARCAGHDTLHVERLIAEPHAARALRHWLARHGIHAVPETRLTETLRQLTAAPDRMPRVQLDARHSLRRHDKHLFLVDDTMLIRDAPGTCWHLDSPLPLANGILRARKTSGPGLDGTIELLRIEYPAPGRRIQPAGRRGTRSVLRLLQEARIPPWQRPVWPLLLVGKRLAAIPAVCIAASFYREAGDNWQLQWGKD